jgi:carotenoid cleavage dioxygenase-like enzyme
MATRFSRRDFLRLSAMAGCVITTGEGLPYCFGEPLVADPQWPDSPFLQGNFGPVQEEITADNLTIVGQLPKELDGMYVRTGPNPQFAPLGNYHWFDGDGMLHGVRIVDGQASYRNRWVRTQGFEAERAAGRALWGGLADPPDIKKLAAGQPLFKNAANTALVWHDGRLLALWEGGAPHAIRVPELETIGPYNYGGKLKHPFTAHPKLDPVTGEMMFFGYSALAPLVQYNVVSAAGELSNTVGVRLEKPVMMHDFAVTERYSIFMDLPVTFDLGRQARGEPLLSYEPERGSRFGILPRHGRAKEIRWFESPGCFVFHTLNAYEDGDDVVLMACRMTEYPDAVKMPPPKTSGDPLDIATMLYRWRFNMRKGETREEALDDSRVDFPRINDKLLGRASRFGYAMDLRSGGLVKYDLTAGSSAAHAHGPARKGGEPVFVSRPNAQGEDDGWLVTFVYDEAEEKSELVVIDAQDFTAEPLARVMLPARVPYGFHGTWVTSEMLASQKGSV